MVILKVLSRFWWYRSQLKCRIFVKGKKKGDFLWRKPFKHIWPSNINPQVVRKTKSRLFRVAKHICPLVVLPCISKAAKWLSIYIWFADLYISIMDVHDCMFRERGAKLFHCSNFWCTSPELLCETENYG